MAVLVYLIPSLLAEDGLPAIHPGTTDAIRDCQVFFTENERTTRRFFKRLWKEMVIDEYEWFPINTETVEWFRQKIREGKNIGIVSEAGCPGVADPGQVLVGLAQEMGVTVKPLVGPSSILLALMASGMNGQQFRFNGYLPIDAAQRSRVIRELEAESEKKDCTQLFIETPYRNNALLEALIKNGKPGTRLCIALNLTGAAESVTTRTLEYWSRNKPDLHKQTVMFCLHAKAAAQS